MYQEVTIPALQINRNVLVWSVANGILVIFFTFGYLFFCLFSKIFIISMINYWCFLNLKTCTLNKIKKSNYLQCEGTCLFTNVLFEICYEYLIIYKTLI